MTPVIFPGFGATAWYGVLAPAGTPKPIISRLHGEIVKALALPDVKERLNSVGLEIVGSAPGAFGATSKPKSTSGRKSPRLRA